MTGVDNCQNDYKKAFIVNVRGTANVAESCKEVGSRLIYLSTCHIFDGKKQVGKSYSENSRPNPPNQYGFTKWEGEEVLPIFGGSHIIIRVSKLFSAIQYRDYFREPFSIERPSFIYRNYTYLPHFADALLEVATNHTDYSKSMKMNLGSQKSIDLCSFWKMLVFHAGYSVDELVLERKEELAGYLPRPYNGSLSMSVASDYGFQLPTTREGVKELVKEL